jgi:hypothetical protein
MPVDLLELGLETIQERAHRGRRRDELLAAERDEIAVAPAPVGRDLIHPALDARPLRLAVHRHELALGPRDDGGGGGTSGC